MKIQGILHTCIMPNGPQAGSQYHQSVNSWHIESEALCDICGEPLAPALEVIAHIYRELTE